MRIEPTMTHKIGHVSSKIKSKKMFPITSTYPYSRLREEINFIGKTSTAGRVIYDPRTCLAIANRSLTLSLFTRLLENSENVRHFRFCFV